VTPFLSWLEQMPVFPGAILSRDRRAVPAPARPQLSVALAVLEKVASSGLHASPQQSRIATGGRRHDSQRRAVQADVSNQPDGSGGIAIQIYDHNIAVQIDNSAGIVRGRIAAEFPDNGRPGLSYRRCERSPSLLSGTTSATERVLDLKDSDILFIEENVSMQRKRVR